MLLLKKILALLLLLIIGVLIFKIYTLEEEVVVPLPVQIVEDPPMVIPEGYVQEGYVQECTRTPPEGLDIMIHEVSTEFGISPRVIALTVWRESGCRASAIGSSGEIGLMQINPRVWTKTLKKEGFVDLRDPLTNLRAGTWIIAKLNTKRRTPQSVLRRYNGSGKMARRYAAEQMDKYLNVWGAPLTAIDPLDQT